MVMDGRKDTAVRLPVGGQGRGRGKEVRGESEKRGHRARRVVTARHSPCVTITVAEGWLPAERRCSPTGHAREGRMCGAERLRCVADRIWEREREVEPVVWFGSVVSVGLFKKTNTYNIY